MQPFSLKLLKSSNRKVRSRFLFPLAFCLLPVPFYIPPLAPRLAIAQTIDAPKVEADLATRIAEAKRFVQQGFQQRKNNDFEAATKSFEAASQSWQQALVICQKNGDRRCEASVLNELGEAYHYLGQHAQSLKSRQQALNLYREINDRAGEGDTLWRIGEFYRVQKEYYKAAEFYQQALPILREVGDRGTEHAVLNNLGTVYANSGQYQQALEFHQQALKITRELGYRQLEEVSLNHIADLQSVLNQYPQALKFLQQALEIARERGDRIREGDILNRIGSDYLRLSQYPQALEYLQQALSIRQETVNRAGEGFTLTVIGIVYEELGQYWQALEYYQQALAIAQEIGARKAEGTNLNNIGELYRKLGQFPQARDALLKSLTIRQSLNDQKGKQVTLNNIGIVYADLGEYSQGLTYLQQALSIVQEIDDRSREGTVLNNIGSVYALLRQYSKALEYYRQSLSIAQEIGNRAREETILNNMGSALLESSQLAAATKTLFNAIKVGESLRAPGLSDANKISLFSTQTRPHSFLQQALVTQNQSEAALEVSERGRARAFVDLLTQRLSPSDANPVVATAPNQEQIRQIAKAQNATLVQYSIIYDGFQIQGKEVWRESALYIWVISPEGEITFRQVDLKPLWQKNNASLANLIIVNQESLDVRSRSSLGSTKSEPNVNLRMLHQLLIDPIANLLPKDPNAHVIFIPQGSLFQVPFPALQDANGTYLIQKHTILTAPSIQVLDLTRQQRQKLAQKPTNGRGRALVLGNPTMPSVSLSPGEPKQQLSPLPGAEAEAIAIAPLLNTQAILGAQGTKAQIVQKMPQASIIHLATHGLLDDVNGLGSAIAMAPSGSDDGLLTAEEIFDMKLQANLVVLSACNTGEGRITGDGVIGLSRALISAGVPSVIVSLWAVPDAPTSELMQAFYQNLEKNPNKAQALRQAMLATMKTKTHSNPRNWAAFTLIGEAE